MLQLWGFGFKDRPGSPAAVSMLITDLKRGRENLSPVTLIGGVPAHWRTLDGDSQSEIGRAHV